MGHPFIMIISENLTHVAELLTVLLSLCVFMTKVCRDLDLNTKPLNTLTDCATPAASNLLKRIFIPLIIFLKKETNLTYTYTYIYISYEVFTCYLVTITINIEFLPFRYIVFTSKHSDGYSLYPTNVTYQWNSRDVGSKRDLLGEKAVKLGMKNKIQNEYKLMFKSVLSFSPVTTNLYLRSIPAD